MRGMVPAVFVRGAKNAASFDCDQSCDAAALFRFCRSAHSRCPTGFLSDEHTGTEPQNRSGNGIERSNQNGKATEGPETQQNGKALHSGKNARFYRVFFENR